MELGIGSDDDLFSEEKDTALKEKKEWIAKQCEWEWFMEDVIDPSSHSSEDAQLISYQADLLFSKKQFAEALAAYKRGIQMVASRFVLLRRILIEGASRCCMYLQDHGQALHFANMLFDESLTLEHRMMAHSLLASVHAAAGNQLDSVKSLHLCVQWQRSNVQFWLKLADAYSALYNQSSHVAHIGHVRSDVINSLITDGLSGSNPTSVHLQEGSLRKSAKTRNSSYKAQSSHKESESLQNDPQQSDDGDVCIKGEQEQSGIKGCTEDGACSPGTIVETSIHVDCSSACTLGTTLETSIHVDCSSVCSLGTTLETSIHVDCSRSDGNHCAVNAVMQDKSSSISDLLNAFDRLAMDPDVKPSCKAMVENLIRRDCQPVLYSASCLLRARLLLKSVEHSVNSFAKVKNSRLQKQVDEHLAILNVDHALLEVLHHHARQIFRKGYKKLDGDVSGDDKEEDVVTDESNLSSELFEKRWFQWVIS